MKDDDGWDRFSMVQLADVSAALAIVAALWLIVGLVAGVAACFLWR